MKGRHGALRPVVAGANVDAGSPRAGLVPIVVVVLAAISLVQAGLYAAGDLPLDLALLVSVAASAATLGVVVLVCRLEGRSLRECGLVLRGPVGPTLLFASLLVFVYLLAETYPGFLLGFGRVPSPGVTSFGLLLLGAPVTALAQEMVFRGYVFRRLSRALPLTAALALSAVAFSLESTDFRLLPSLSAVSGAQYLFEVPVANFVLGLLLALYFYKERWSLLGPVATRTGLLWASTLLPIGARFTNWETGFAALLLAYGALMVLVAVGLREPRLQARQYLGEPIGPRRHRFRHRAEARRQVRETVLAVAVVALAGAATTQIAPVVTGTSPPLLAIATGSMVPTFHRGDLVVLEHARVSAITVGTIIAFRVGCLPAPTVHRVYRILVNGSAPVYQTKGDANLAPDPCSVPFHDVVGVEVAVLPYLGFFVLDPLLTAGVLVLVVLIMLLVPRRTGRRPT